MLQGYTLLLLTAACCVSMLLLMHTPACCCCCSCVCPSGADREVQRILMKQALADHEF
jgi:hypothetical protein